MEKSGWLGGWASEDSRQLVDAQGMQGCRAVIVEKQVEEAGRERGLAIVFCWCLRTFLALVACLAGGGDHGGEVPKKTPGFLGLLLLLLPSGRQTPH